MDKFNLEGDLKLTKEASRVVKAPCIAESPLCLECKVRQIIPLGTHDMFIGEVVSTNVDESLLDENGRLQVLKAEGDFDFSAASTNNIFGIDSTNLLIIPGSYFKADMRISNAGNVAFNYNVGIQLLGESNALAEQLQVTITHPDGKTTTKMLSEMIQGVTIDTGELIRGGAAQNFSVEIRFVDVSGNNAAQTQIAEFDLLVTAVQSTH